MGSENRRRPFPQSLGDHRGNVGSKIFGHNVDVEATLEQQRGSQAADAAADDG
ncbi:MAG TPA: hypothetical protein VGO67_00675 [Verrucomicrobiae bacterium]|jgi:hypothetical protein